MSTLASHGLRPNLDYLLFQTRMHPQLSQFTQTYLDKYSDAPLGLSVFCILQKYSTDDIISLILSYLEENGFREMSVIHLNRHQSLTASSKFRSGRWSIGTKTSSGAVSTLIVFLDPKPVIPKFNALGYKFPIDNLRLQKCKQELRTLINYGVRPAKGNHIIHSSDCAPQALYYLLECGIRFRSLHSLSDNE